MASFYTLLTTVGDGRLVQAIALGQTVNLTHMALGDGNGVVPTPTEAATALVHEVYRSAINTLTTDSTNPNWLVAEMVIPATTGGWTIREAGLFDDSGSLFAVANFPETYKPILTEGAGNEMVIRLVIQLTNAAAVTLKVDPSVVLSTRQYVDSGVAAHAASRNHPDASATAKGFVELATVAETQAGTDDTRAVTPAGLAPALALKSPLDSPAFTGTPAAPTAAAGNNSTQLATTAFVQAAVALLVDASPATLDTLNELAAALGDDANFATTVTTALGLKAPLDSPALTGNPTAPTPTAGDNDTSIATTAFVQAAVVAGGAGTVVRVARAANTQIVAADKGKVFGASGTWTQTFAAVATLGANWSIFFANEGTGIVTLDPNGAETIDGLATINVYPGESFLLQCDGLALRTIGRDKGRTILLAEFGTVAGQSLIDLTTGFGDTELNAINIEIDGFTDTGGGFNPTVSARSAGAALTSGYQGQLFDASATSALAQNSGSTNMQLHASGLNPDYRVQIELRVRRWRSTIGLHGPVLIFNSNTYTRSSYGNMKNSNLAAWDGIRFTGSSMGYDKIRIFGVR